MFCYIYKLIKKDAENDNMVYIGSSCDIDVRWRAHISNCNNPESKQYNLKVYKYIRDNGGIEEWQMIILDEFEIPLKKCVERDNYENEYILKYDAINKLNEIKAFRTKEEIIEYNKERKKKWYKNNAEKIKENKKEKVYCNICGSFLTKNHLARHKLRDICTNFNTFSSQTF